MKLCWFQLYDRLLGCVSNDKEISATTVHMHNSSTLQDEVYQAIMWKYFICSFYATNKKFIKKKQMNPGNRIELPFWLQIANFKS